MSSAANTTKVFISYSHADAGYLRELQGALSSADRAWVSDYWDDTKLSPGSKWRNEIARAVESAKVAVLLISPDFFASEFIQRHELPPLLAAADAGETQLICIILRPCDFEKTQLARFQAMNNPARTVSQLSPSERGAVWMHVAQQIRRALIAPPPAPAANKMTRERLKAAIENRDTWHKIDLIGQDLSGLNLAGLDLRSVKLAKTNLRRTNLTDVLLGSWAGDQTDLTDADLSYAVLTRVNLYSVKLVNTVLRGADLTGASLYMARLEQTDLTGANLSQCKLLDATIKSAVFEGVTARDTVFRGDFARSNLRGTSFAGADLQGAQLFGCTLTDMTLDEADLRSANLSRATLKGASLRGAQLQGADLRGVDLRDVNLDNADLSGAKLSGAKYDSVTVWPRSFDPFAHGLIQAPSR